MFKLNASRSLRASFAALALGLAVACGGGGGGDGGGGGGGGGGGTPGAAPVLSGYSQDPIVAEVDVALTPVTPTVTGTVNTWTVVPSLPSGMALDPTTGVISGTPTGARMPATSFTVTAANANGSDSLTITVRLIELPGLSAYLTDPASYEVGEPIAPNAPILSGDADSFSVLPPLPAGLTLHPSTGVISGTPTTVLSETGFQVTATNVDGATSVTLRIAIVPGFLMRIASDRPLAKSDLLPSAGFTPSQGGLFSAATLLPTNVAGAVGRTPGGMAPTGSPTPVTGGLTPTGTGASFLDATVPFTAQITITGTPPAPWTPACTVLAPFTALSCSLSGFPLPRAEIQSAPLQLRVFDAGGPESLLTNPLQANAYQIGQVSNISPRSNDTLLSLFTLTSDDRLVFRGHNTFSAAKLFVYDDAAGGSLEQLTNTRNSQNVSDNVSSVSGLVEFNGKLMFAANDGSGLRKLFEYAPATDTLTRLSNTFPGNADRPEEFAVHNGRFYFTARNPENRRKLYRYTDGLAPTVEQVTELNPVNKNDAPSDTTSYNGKLYFAANADIDGALRKLYVYDDAVDTVTQLVDITGPLSTDAPRDLMVFGDSLYFTALSGSSTVSRKLYRYESSSDTLVQVTNTAGGAHGDEIAEMTAYNGKLFFTAAANASGSIRKLYSYEPTGGGTVLRITDTAGASSSDDPEYLTVHRGCLFFRATRTGGAAKLFRYDDLTAELRQVSNTSGSPTQSDDPRHLMEYGNKLYLSAWSSFAVAKLFVYDDTDGSLVQLTDTHVDPTLTDSPVPQVVYNDKLFFTAFDEEARVKLYAVCDRGTGCTMR